MRGAGHHAGLVGTLKRAKAGEMRAWKVGVVVLAVVLAGGVFYGWWEWMHPGLPDGIPIRLSIEAPRSRSTGTRFGRMPTTAAAGTSLESTALRSSHPTSVGLLRICSI